MKPDCFLHDQKERRRSQTRTTSDGNREPEEGWTGGTSGSEAAAACLLKVAANRVQTQSPRARFIMSPRQGAIFPGRSLVGSRPRMDHKTACLLPLKNSVRFSP